MQTTFQVQGVKESKSLNSEVENEVTKSRSRFEVKHAVRFESSRAEGTPPIVLDNLEDDYVIELTFEDDIKRWVTVKEFKEEFSGTLSGDRATGALVIPQSLNLSKDQTRGIGSWILKSLKVFDFDPIDAVVGKVAEKAAGALAEHIDKRLVEEEDLYLMKGIGAMSALKKGETIKRGGAALILMHGTISNTEKSFKKLPPEIFTELKEHFDGQVYAYEHHTLSRHPIDNAIKLLERIPANKEIHLLSTSRGGLIGELLTRGMQEDDVACFDEIDIDLYEDEDLAELQNSLRELNKLLSDKRPVIKRFVRVACPSGGTTLASGRLDRWLEGLLNVIGKVTGADLGELYGIITDFLLEVKKNSTNPEEMPGLACQMPTSSLIRMLNRRDIEVDADLSVIAGDIQGAGILGKVGVFLTDLFYLEDHDLVVPTRAMYGGVKRKNALFFFDQGSEVSHFNYMRNKETNTRIKTALTVPKTYDLTKEGFAHVNELRRRKAAPDVTRGTVQSRGGEDAPVVFVLPGIMGSNLSVDNHQIWLNALNLSLGKMTRLEYKADSLSYEVAPDSILGRFYGNLVDYLSATHVVIPFPYDWRKSILKEAERFRETLRVTLEETDKPVRIIAHSMGGLVARAALDGGPAVYDSFKKREGSRFIMLGTPNQGSFEIVQVLTGRSRTLNQLATFDLRNKKKRILEIVSSFPGVLELLPFDDEEKTFFDVKTWERLFHKDMMAWESKGKRIFRREWKKKREWVIPKKQHLEKAKQLQEVLGMNSLDPKHTIYVAGYNDKTPINVSEKDNEPVGIIGTTKGDGSVPWETGIPQKLTPWYLPAAHNKLAAHKKSFSAISELLETGSTSLLPHGETPPWASRSTLTQFDMPEELVELFPEEENIEALLFGEDLDRIEVQQPATSLHVSVAHGNLAFCKEAVAMGHYEEQPLVSAEKHLDGFLDNRLSARHSLGAYPGAINSSEVIFAANPDTKPGGAIIVGLGISGQLNPKKLVDTCTAGLVNYAIKYYEHKVPLNDERTLIPISFSSLLIGSGGWGVSIEDSVRSILKSIQRANEKLRTHKVTQNCTLFYSHIQFIELYKDRALEALRISKEVKKELDLGLSDFHTSSEVILEVDQVLQNMDGGQRRIMYREFEGWEQPLTVRGDKQGSLIFTAYGERARAEESSLSIQLSNMDRLVEQAISSSRWDTDLASAMFELLIPNGLKGYANNQKDLMMIVDDVSARYPWELLFDRRSAEKYPIVTQVGYIRRFATTTYRQHVEDVLQKNVLIIGNPGNLPEGFQLLPGASREATLVAKKLQDTKDYKVTALIDEQAKATDIMVQLMANDYKIIHLAGHGVHGHSLDEQGDEAVVQESTKTITGMVLGDGIYLTANELDQMPQVPELVFVNCCFLGTMDDFQSNRFAASFARQLIDMGVKAVIAAGWAVDDAAAQTFAERFYSEMLKGSKFKDAVKDARKETYDKHHDRTNTWGAYQCYGNPNYAFEKNEGSSTEQKTIDLLDREELEIELWNISSRAQTASWQRVSSLKEELTELESHVSAHHSSWLNNTVIQEAFASAFKEVNIFDKSVEYYQKATASNRTSIKSIEQLANIRARKAAMDYEREILTYNAALKEIEQCILDIETLNAAFGETSERLSLLGSAQKRHAMIAGDKQKSDSVRQQELKKTRLEALKKMASHYKNAFKLDENSHYPITNEAFALALKSWIIKPTPTQLKTIKGKIDTALQLAKEKKDKNTKSFWDEIGVSDVEFVQSLYFMAGGNKKYTVELLGKDMDRLAESYIQVWKRFGSAGKLRSVIEQLHVLLVILKTENDFLSSIKPAVDKAAVLNIFETMYQKYRMLLEQEK